LPLRATCEPGGSLNAYVKQQTGYTLIVFARKELSLPTPFNSYAMAGREASSKWLDYMARDFTINHTRFVRCAHGSSACVVDTTSRAYGFDGSPKMPAWYSQEEFKRHNCHRQCGTWVDPPWSPAGSARALSPASLPSSAPSVTLFCPSICVRRRSSTLRTLVALTGEAWAWVTTKEKCPLGP
jgi:hypothetical protein